MLVREFEEGQEIDQVLLARGRCELADRSGAIGTDAECEPGSIVRVTGRVAGGRLRGSAWRPAREDEFALEDLLDGPHRSAGGMEADLRELVATVQNPHLRALLDAVL